MKTQRAIFLGLVLCAFFEAGCRGCSEPKRHGRGDPSDAGPISRVECDDPLL